MLSPAGPEHLRKLRNLLIKGAYERRDVWPDRKSVMAALRKRERTKKWDTRVLKVFIVSSLPLLSTCLSLIRDRNMASLPTQARGTPKAHIQVSPLHVPEIRRLPCIVIRKELLNLSWA